MSTTAMIRAVASVDARPSPSITRRVFDKRGVRSEHPADGVKNAVRVARARPFMAVGPFESSGWFGKTLKGDAGTGSWTSVRLAGRPSRTQAVQYR